MMLSRSRARAFLGPTATAALVGAILGASLTIAKSRSANSPFHRIREWWITSSNASFTLPMFVAIAMWVVFSLYWEVKAKSASRSTRSESRLSRTIHLTLISLTQLMVFFPIPGLRARFLPASGYFSAIGLLMEVSFFSFGIWAREMLGRHWSGAVSAKHDHELVRSGPYSVLRHPIYTAIIGAYASTAVVSGEIHGLIGVAIVTFAYARKIHIEERYLREIFGAAYESYREDTWALIPGVL